METNPISQQETATEGGRALPEDFANRMATKIAVTNERERDPEAATQKIGLLILRNLGSEDRLPYFLDTLDILLDQEEGQRYAAIAYVSVALPAQSPGRFEDFLKNAVNFLIEGHTNISKPPYMMENRRKKYSHYARHLGDVFINMIDFNSDLYEVISQIYSLVIRREMAIEAAEREPREGSRRHLLAARDGPKAAKKLFDEIVDYIQALGEFRSDSLNVQNPNEFMVILADRMRGTRRYVIQDIMNRQSIARRKEVEKELSERLANAEDIILTRDAFKKALNLFWTEKLYNFKYLSVEKVRVTVQVTGIVIGIFYFLVGYLGFYGMEWWEGVLVALGMYLYSRFICSRRAFARFFPDDVSKELEVTVGTFTPTVRKMSKEQMDAFLIRQVKDTGNLELLPVVPEFVKYVFAVMPERKSAVIQLDELSEIMENLELDIARALRQAAAARGY